MTSDKLMNQQQLAKAEQGVSKETCRAGGGRLLSSLRAIGMALMLFAGAFSVGYADHMGNHLRPNTETADESATGSGQACNSDSVDDSTTTQEDDLDSSGSVGGRPR